MIRWIEKLFCWWYGGHTEGKPIGPDIYGATRTYCLCCGKQLRGPGYAPYYSD